MVSDTDPVDRALLDRLVRASAPAIADTKHDGVAVLSPAIDPVHTDCAFAGTARTVALDPDSLWPPVRTLDAASEDEVVVVDTDDAVDEAVWGELLSTYANAAGVRGTVTNGAVRDVAGTRDLGFPVFARAVTPRGPSGSAEAAQNVAVTVGGVSVEPGDVLVGDESGVVVIERGDVEDVADAAGAVAETERAAARSIREGTSLERALEDAGML